MPPLVILGVVAVALLGYTVLTQKGSTVVVPAAAGVDVSQGGGSGSGLAPSVAPAGIAAVGLPDGSSAPPRPLPPAQLAQPSPGTTVATGPASSPPPPGGSRPLDWIMSQADALKAGVGHVYRDPSGALFSTGPRGAIKLTGIDRIYGNSLDAIKAGAGSIYQQGGKYYVAAPGAPVQLAAGYNPSSAAIDTSTYGSVTGVVRGWAVQADRLGNVTSVPAHSVPGSTYGADAQGAAPTAQELGLK